jgi:hypothetical protein
MTAACFAAGERISIFNGRTALPVARGKRAAPWS